MDIPKLRVSTTPAQMSINTTKPIQEIQQPQADISIEQPMAEVSMETIQGKLTIDQTEAWADMDLKSFFRRGDEFAQQGYQALLDGIARRVQDGDELMKIENGSNAIVNQAERNSAPPIYEFNIGWIPKAGSVKVNFEPGSVKIDVQLQKPKVNIKANLPIINYTPGKVNIDVKQYSSINIEFQA
ncbi:DUF6470 family protein [Peribacillus alkalitolerans]|uniref:DUF6470 family protein n=1 Tax=Peribacillus alkalitolerans TaxID=1550385 RepID=UPI0013D88701|nr:DUF6470 family protein [Peribacillus alkalitolerans]